jgi:dCMP deaminase
MARKTDQEYLLMAYHKATESPDPSTQNGAVIPYKLGPPMKIQKASGDVMDIFDEEFTLEACNTFPKGVLSKPERHERPLKYNYIEHAERGAVYEAARWGVKLTGLTMYVPWAACSDCARSIICSGIRRLVMHKDMMDRTPEHWKESIRHAFDMFNESGIILDYVEGKLNAPAIRMNGEIWTP